MWSCFGGGSAFLSQQTHGPSHFRTVLMFCLKLKFWGRWGKDDQDQVRDLEGDLDVVVVDKVDMSQHQGVSRTSRRGQRISYMHNCIICSSASSTSLFCLNAPFSFGVQCCSVRWTICHIWRSQKWLQANCSRSCSLSHSAGSFNAGLLILWSIIFALLESWFLLAWMPRWTSLWVCSKPPLCCLVDSALWPLHSLPLQVLHETYSWRYSWRDAASLSDNERKIKSKGIQRS